MIKDILETKLAMAINDIRTGKTPWTVSNQFDESILEEAIVSINYKLDALLKEYDARKLFAMPILDVANLLSDIDATKPDATKPE